MALRLNDDRSRAYGRSTFVMICYVTGEGDRSKTQQYVEIGIQEADRTDDVYLHNSVRTTAAWDSLQRGFTDRGRKFATELQERGRARRDPRATGVALWLLGWIDAVEARYEDALEHSSECIRTAITPMDREIATQVKGVALIALGRIKEGADLLRDHRKRAIANEFLYCRTGTDGALGLAMVLQGDFARGARFLRSAIRHHDQTGATVGRDFTRITLAEIYSELLASKQRPPWLVIAKNFPILVSLASTGWQKAVKLLLEARKIRFSARGVSGVRGSTPILAFSTRCVRDRVMQRTICGRLA